MVFFLMGMVISGLYAWRWWPVPLKGVTLYRCYVYSPSLPFSSKFRIKKRGVNNNGTDGNWGQSFFRFYELSVNHTISAIFNLWEVCKMKSYNMLTIEAKVRQVPELTLFTVKDHSLVLCFPSFVCHTVYLHDDQKARIYYISKKAIEQDVVIPLSWRTEMSSCILFLHQWSNIHTIFYIMMLFFSH